MALRVVARLVFSASVDRGVVPAALQLGLGVLPFLGAALLSLLTPWVTARIAARPAARAKPVQALAEAAIPPVRVSQLRRLLALVFAVGTVGLASTTMFMGPQAATATGGPAVLTGAIAVALVAPELLAWLVTRSAPWVRGVVGPDAELALVNTRTRAVAGAAVLTPLVLATAVALGNVYSMTTVGSAATSGYVDQFEADGVITSAAGGIPPGVVATVRDTPGVASASALVTSRGWIEQPYDGKGSDPMRLLGIDPQDRDAVLTTKVAAGSLAGLTGDTVAVPRSQADELGFAVGDTIALRLGDGAAVRARVVALLDGSARYPSLVLPADLLAAHTTPGLPTQVLLRAGSGQDTAEVVKAVRDRLAEWPGITVGGQSVLSETFAAGLDVEAWINYLLAALAIAYAAIAAVNTLAAAVLARRAEFGVQRLTGATRAQVRRMLLIEGGIIAAAGLALGTAISVFTVWPTAIAVGQALPSGPVWFFFALAGTVGLIVVPATALAARLAMKRRPFEAISVPGQ